MQTVSIIAVGNEFVGYLLGVFSSSAKHNAIDVWIMVCDTFERVIFVLSLNSIIDMFYIF